MKLARHLHLLGATGAIRTTSFHGREHIAVPVVALIEGVIFPVNASTPELVLASEFTVAPQGWNGRPVVAGHPAENGVQVSANSPRVLEERSFGTIFNTRCDGKRLLMEAWLDPAKAKAVGRDAERVIERVQAGEPVEVSVGVFVVAEDKIGTFADKEYKAIWHEITPDHLAMLPEGVLGACSNTMGCGVRTAQVHCVTAEGMEVMDLQERYDAEQRMAGGPGSGNFGHAGRPGEEGGSAPSGGGGGHEPFKDYSPARKHAQTEANRLKRPMAVEKAKEYGKTVYRVKMLPIKEQDRSGWETRAEVVNPEEKSADGTTRSYAEREYPPSKKDDGQRRWPLSGDFAHTGRQSGPGSGNFAKTERRKGDRRGGPLSGNFAHTGRATEEHVDEELRDAAGKRHSASDEDMIQMMHDKSVELGASCGGNQELKFADRFVRTMEAADGYRALVAGLDPKILEGEPSADKAEHPFTYCMEVVIPAMEKAPDDPEAFCGWWKAERTAESRAATLKAAEHNCSCGGQRAAEGDQVMPDDKTKKDKVKELIDDDETPFTKDDEEWLAKVEDDKLTAVKKNAQVKAAARKEATEKATADAVAKALAEAKPKSEAEWLSSAPEGVRRMYNRAAQAEATEKASLIAALKTAQTEFAEEELTTLPIEQLQRLSRVAKVAEPVTSTVVDFGARVPRVAAASSETIPPPPDMNAIIRAARAK